MRLSWIGIASLLLLVGCAPPQESATSAPAAAREAAPIAPAAARETATTARVVATNVCEGPYPSYWQDSALTSTGMWEGQTISNQPPPGYTGPVFKLSQKFPPAADEDPSDRGWLNFDPFKAGLSQDEMTRQSQDYSWAVMKYLQEGHIDSGDVEKDWNHCANRARNWYNMPYQTYDPLSGREFMHGLTREAPVTFTLKNGQRIKTTVWAIAFYNATGAKTVGDVWGPDGKARPPASNLAFADGTVVGKLLFTTATAAQMPNLTNLPSWTINMSDAAFCSCRPSGSARPCTLAEMSAACPRRPGTVTLLQFDIGVRDSRAPGGWVFGTFVADGENRAAEPNPWNRIAPLGLMWGNDPPPAGQAAALNPPDPRRNGFKSEAIFWDVADRLNAASNAGHLGCNSRLNGPADNIASTCISCHMTASLLDKNGRTPPIIAQFGGIKPECATPANINVDAVYFADTGFGKPFQGGSVVPPPDYGTPGREWISLDFSLQLSISLVQWQEWQEHQSMSVNASRGILPASARAAGKFMKYRLPGR